jgi:VIT1/CCC1 family predicted Fe2+/Mn2+ transporter
MSADRIGILFCAVIPPLVAVAVVTHQLVLLIVVVAAALVALFALGRAVGQRGRRGGEH